MVVVLALVAVVAAAVAVVVAVVFASCIAKRITSGSSGCSGCGSCSAAPGKETRHLYWHCLATHTGTENARTVLDIRVCKILVHLTRLLHPQHSVSAGRLQNVILGDVAILAAVALESVRTPRARAKKPRAFSVRLLVEFVSSRCCKTQISGSRNRTAWAVSFYAQNATRPNLFPFLHFYLAGAPLDHGPQHIGTLLFQLLVDILTRSRGRLARLCGFCQSSTKIW